MPAYLGVVTCTGLNALGKVKGARLPKILCRCVALAGAAGTAVSTLAGVFAPVFPMPKPTGPYRVGKTTRLWVDRNRRSWLLKTKRVFGARPLPEHRMMMADIWYPARADFFDAKGSAAAGDPQPPWPADEEAEARFAERARQARDETERGDPTDKKFDSRPRDGATPDRRRAASRKRREEAAKHQARYEAKRAEARKSGKRRRAHWLDPTLATTLAESFYLPGWVVDYFRLVKMEATEDAPVADPPVVRSPSERSSGEPDTPVQVETGGFPVVLFSHSFTGVKEQNSALLQEMASWGHVVVAVDHPHDAALVLYPDGSTADFRGYDMPKESEPRNWWRFRHEHARWRALDLAHALERVVELSFHEASPLRGKIDLSRVACVGHSFGGAAAVMLAQMDPRITSVVALDPWMWPLGRETAAAGCPCPLLVLEAPEFMWNRDIFCVTNGETSSLMCAATAPRAAAAAARREKKTNEDSNASEFSNPRGDHTCAKDARSRRAVQFDDERLGEDASDVAAEDPAREDPLMEDPSKPPPGFAGAEVDGHAGVGFYNRDGYYYASNPPSSPTSRRRSAHFRPQHPRLGSSENLASFTSFTSMASLSSARSVGSVASLAGSEPREKSAAGDADVSGISADADATAAPTAEEEAAAAVAAYAAGRPPRDPSSLAFLAHAGGASGAETQNPETENALRASGSWSNVLRAVNADAEPASAGDHGLSSESPGLRTVGSWGSLRRPFRRRSIGERRKAEPHGGTSVSSLGTSAYGFETQRDPSGVAFKAVLRDTMHFDFTDIAMIAPLAATVFGVVGVGGREVHDVTSAATLRFLRMFNHPRDPDHSDPDAAELEKLRAKLLSSAPVASVRAEETYGFSGGNEIDPEKTGSDKNVSVSLPRLKLGKMGHPATTHRGVRGSLARGKKAAGGAARDAAFRKSFDATHLPENWMDLEGADLEGGSDDPETRADAGARNAEDVAHVRENTSGGLEADRGEDPRRRSGGRSEKRSETERAFPATAPSRRDADADADAATEATEAKPRIVRWVKSHEWILDSDRAFDESQRREMRWLLHECRKLGTHIQPSDFVAMFPSFDTEAIKRAALRELTSEETHPAPKPLVWLAQMVVDGDIPRHTSEGGNHHGVPDEELERAEDEAT